ncbi:hypothetical protein MNBD_BACTEROID03-529 [hydrothermal vent metagenome]|uniref:Uncharacterized protein n=1 Tax=hydrothermal vent metagenome TaxID=652676 RepID=A0A3B0T8Y8_9ZZZZ
MEEKCTIQYMVLMTPFEVWTNLVGGGEAIVYDGAFTNGMSQSKIFGGGGQFLNSFTVNNPGFLNTQAGLDIVSN